MDSCLNSVSELLKVYVKKLLDSPDDVVLEKAERNQDNITEVTERSSAATSEKEEKAILMCHLLSEYAFICLFIYYNNNNNYCYYKPIRI